MKRSKKDLLTNVNDVKSAKVIDNNTLRIVFNNGNEVIRLHDTDIITFAGPDIILNSGGWRTSTTKERINKYSPAYIIQNKGLWYLANNRNYPHNVNECKLFYDGCNVNQSGELISKEIKVNDNKINKLKKQISKYVNLISKDNLPLPSAGDCWFCSLHDKDNIPMGELVLKDYSHLHSHLKEGYLHGSILVNAMREAGYQDQQIGVHYQLKVVDTFKCTLRRYLQKRLISNIAVK